MSRSLLAWCCAAALSTCLPGSPVHSMTVSPIVFSTSTTTTTSASPLSDYQSYAGGAGVSGGPYGVGRGETTYSSYGHRTIPESQVAKVRVGRNEPPSSHALYESPHTYEYMTNPRKGSRLRQDGTRTRVPKTEQRPPGDDVEYVVDARPPRKSAVTKDRRRYVGNNNGYRYRNEGGRYDEYDDEAAAAAEDDRRRRHEEMRKRKRKRKTSLVGGGRWVTEPEVGSSSKKNVRKDTVVKVRDNNGRVVPQYHGKKTAHVKKHHGTKGTGSGAAKKIREREELIGYLEPQVNHKIHKKNEFSKKHQFIDEEHLDIVTKKPIVNRNKKDRNKKRVGGHHDNSSKKRKRRVMKDTNKDLGNFEHVKQKPSQGYGHVLAVR